MLKRNKKKQLTIALLSIIFFLIIAISGFIYLQKNISVNNTATTPTSSPINPPVASPTNTSTTIVVNSNISDGINGKIFIKYNQNKISPNRLDEEYQKLKESKNFKAARENPKFRYPGSPYCEDPETLIYFNNADIKDKESYTIAVAVPLEGDAKESGLEILLGVAQAQNEFNKKVKNKQIQQKPIKVIVASEEEKNLNATTDIANSLVNYQNSEILGIIGHYTSDATEAAIKVYDNLKLGDKRVVLVSPTSTKTEIQNNGYFFRTVPNNQKETDALVDYILNNEQIHPKEPAVIFNSQSAFSRSLKDEFVRSFKSKAGKEVNFIYDVDAPQKIDLIKDSQINSQQKKFSIVLLAVPVTDIGKTYFLLQNRDAQKFFYLGGDTIYDPKILTEPTGDVAQRFRNIVIAVPWHYTFSSVQSKSFVKNTSELWCQQIGKEDHINWRRATAYDAANVLIEAISNNPTREGIKQYLSQTFSMEGATGTIKFNINGDMDEKSKLVRLHPENYKFELVDQTGELQN
ncbi:ABC transporter substrate-binding protein [Nostoc sp. FACHB-110]|uniref:ABC transporter substrate-binding protein n=1 Tax=Nostoc sp. FACHB-110 TaxID=2692834 RepID=UPI0016895007|nr:ABC transporter substrate-binding protein [Nostoc sp. FACHB-110]MBD2439976.1 amino acid ABC transporter substrate-binding protein [Nostoc sp. FACHB-110]